MSDWEALTLEEGETEHVPCDCCGRTTVLVTGDVFRNGDWLAWYKAAYGEIRNDPHSGTIWLYMGGWSDEAPRSARWGMRAEWRQDGLVLLDWPEDFVSEEKSFTPLGRDDILGSAFAPELWTMMDAIVLKDSRLQEIHCES